MAAVGWFLARRRAKNGVASSMGNGQFAGAAPGGFSAPNVDSVPSSTQRTSLDNTGGGFSGIGSGAGGQSASQGIVDATAPAAVPELPVGFEIDGFLRNAKVYFLRLQAANDASNVADIREFTTPEMFAELSLDIQERKGAKQHTEVNSVDTQFMGIETQGSQYVAGVKYTGLISEDGAAPTSFKEAWVLVKPVDGSSGWLLAGIEQVQ
jgi:predicted lipid-binding transport protein (Tim44 family)